MLKFVPAHPFLHHHRLDAESHYRLTVEQTKEAKQGASYASDEYEKWKTAYKKAKADLEATLARHAEERTSLGEEREVIKEILRYLGVLHDVKATEKSIAAGGRDSKIDEETGVSEVKAVKTATLKAKMAKLQSLVLKTKQPGAMQKLAQIQKLPVYSETEEVARVLKEMLADLQTRLDVLEDVDKKAKEIADEAYNKMVEWEGKLVALSDQADKAKEKMMVCSYACVRRQMRLLPAGCSGQAYLLCNDAHAHRISVDIFLLCRSLRSVTLTP